MQHATAVVHIMFAVALLAMWAPCVLTACSCVPPPRFKRLPPLHTYMMMGDGPGWSNSRDPLAVGLDEELG